MTAPTVMAAVAVMMYRRPGGVYDPCKWRNLHMNLPNGRLHAKEVMMKIIIGVELTAAR